MAHSARDVEWTSHPPNSATDAILKRSAPVPSDSREVCGIEFNDHKDTSITVEDLVAGMSRMGFQASALSEAVRIINDMVRLQRDNLSSRPSAKLMEHHRLERLAGF